MLKAPEAVGTAGLGPTAKGRPRKPSASTSTSRSASVAAESLRITGVGRSSTLTSSISRSNAKVASRTALETASRARSVRFMRATLLVGGLPDRLVRQRGLTRLDPWREGWLTVSQGQRQGQR
jgi:hypothetical protein